MNVRVQILLNGFYICLGIGQRERERERERFVHYFFSIDAKTLPKDGSKKGAVHFVFYSLLYHCLLGHDKEFIIH